MDNEFGDTKTEARLKQNHYNGGLVSLGKLITSKSLYNFEY